MDGDIKTVKIYFNNKKNKKRINNNKEYLEDQIEIKQECLKYFHGCWIRCIKKSNGEYNSGGFLTKLSYDIVYLRSIQNPELIEFETCNYKFYVKKNNEQYIAMQQIELEKERNKIENIKIKNKMKKVEEKEKKYKMFEKEKLKFEKIKEKFFKLFEEGKVKIYI